MIHASLGKFHQIARLTAGDLLCGGSFQCTKLPPFMSSSLRWMLMMSCQDKCLWRDFYGENFYKRTDIFMYDTLHSNMTVLINKAFVQQLF